MNYDFKPFCLQRGFFCNRKVCLLQKIECAATRAEQKLCYQGFNRESV